MIETIITQNETTNLDVSDWARRATLDIIGVAGLGQDFNSIRDPSGELYQTYNKLFASTRGAKLVGIMRLLLPKWVISSLPYASPVKSH